MHECDDKCSHRQTYASMGIEPPARDAKPMEKAASERQLRQAVFAAWKRGELYLCSKTERTRP